MGWLFLVVFLVFAEVLGAFLRELFNILGKELAQPRLQEASLFLSSNLTQLVKLAILGVFYLFTKGKMKRVPMVKREPETGLLVKVIVWMFGMNMCLGLAETFFNKVSGITLGIPIDYSVIGVPVAIFLMIAVFPAIVEEIIFRFIVFRYLRRHGIVFAAVASSILFGMMHLNILQMVFAALMGLITCYVYEKTGKLRYPILLHLLNNSFAVIMMSLTVNETALAIINILLIIGFLAGIIYLGIKDRVENRELLARVRGVARPLRYFFTSIPMLLYTFITLGLSVWIIFIFKNNPL